MTGFARDNKSKQKKSNKKPSKKQIIVQAFKFHSQGNITEATKYYEYFIKQGFHDHRVFSNYGVILRDLGKLKEAKLCQQKAIEIKPNYPIAYSNLGGVLKDLGKLKEAELATRKAIELNPNNVEVYSNLGSILRDLGKLKEAELATRKAIELNPEYPQAYSNLGGVLKDLGKLKEAELATRKAIELNPNNVEVYSNLGSILRDLGKLKEAGSCIQQAIELNPEYPQAHLNLGNIFRDLGKLKEAELATRKAIKLKSEYPQAHLNLGNILRDLGKLKEAELAIRKAIELNPELSNAHRDLSICLYLLEDLNSAMKSINKANSLNTKDIVNQLLLRIFKTGKNKNREILNHPSKFNKQNLGSNTFIFNLPVDEKLINALYQQESQDQEIYQGPTYGDAKGSDYKLFDSDDKNIKNIKEELITIAKNSINSEIFISESFFTIFRAGGGLISHDHLGEIDKVKGLNIASKKFSLVYYLEIGDQNCEMPGILKLENPNQEILPTNGLVIIFPASRKHSVFYKGKKDRLIIGINFYKI